MGASRTASSVMDGCADHSHRLFRIEDRPQPVYPNLLTALLAWRP